MNRYLIACAVALCTPMPLAAQEAPPVAAIRQAVDDHAGEALALYREFLALPNDAHYPGDIEALTAWMEDAFRSRGFDTQRLPMPGSDALFASRRARPGDPVVLVYLQADGQPVDPSAWDQEDPFTPVLKARDGERSWTRVPWERAAAGIDPEWRVFARSAADSKGPMTQFLMAMTLLDRLGYRFPYHLKVIVDTEEELGSPHLAAAVASNEALLASDLLLIFDGPPHASNRPTVKFGARGIATATLVTHGPLVAQHSGHYGNFVPNPAFDLARILASLKTPDGVVAIPGFYRGIEIDEATRQILARVPDDEAKILRDLGVSQPDAVAATLQEALQYPSLNIRGMQSAWIGDQARTIIPATATAELDIRLVRESDPDYLLGLLRAHIEGQGYRVLERAPTAAERRKYPRIVTFTHSLSYAAFRSDFDSVAGSMARGGLRRLYGEEPILIRTSGGSIPISPFVDVLGLPAATVPTVNMDNNQHSPDENLRLGNFFEGIAMLMAVLTVDPTDLT